MDDIFIKIFSIIISLGLLSIVLLAKSHVGTLLNPGSMFAGAWFLYTSVPLILIFNAPVNPLSILFILICSLFFAVPIFLFNWRKAFISFEKSKKRANFLIETQSTFLFVCLWICCLFGIIFSVWTMIINGWSINEMLFDTLATSGRFAAVRGNEGMEYGVIGTLGVFFTYLTATIGGIVYGARFSNSKKLVYLGLSFAPGVLTMVIQSSKLIFLISSLFFVGSLVLIKIYKIKLNVFEFRFFKNCIISFLMVSPFILASFLSRENDGNLDSLSATLNMLMYAFASYALGQIYAFSDFFAFYIGQPSISNYLIDYDNFGAYTFTSIHKLFGINKDFPPGLYLETGYYLDVFETNIFTIFRGMIYDFGIIGTLLVFLILGTISTFAFYGILRGYCRVFSNVIFVHITVFIFISYLFSVFMARYMYSNAIAFYIILILNKFIVYKKLHSSPLRLI